MSCFYLRHNQILLCSFFRMTNESDNTYDYIVIGGGTSGLVAVRRLAESEGNFSVCLLEVGPRFVSLLKH